MNSTAFQSRSKRMAAFSVTITARGTKVSGSADFADEVNRYHLSNHAAAHNRINNLVSTAGCNTCLRSPETQTARRPITITPSPTDTFSSHFV